MERLTKAEIPKKLKHPCRQYWFDDVFRVALVTLSPAPIRQQAERLSQNKWAIEDKVENLNSIACLYDE